MEEGRLAARLLSEIGSARAAIAASYLSLWRSARSVSEEHQDGSPPAVDLGDAPASAPPPGCQETSRRESA
jgi:hypothetical protein